MIQTGISFVRVVDIWKHTYPGKLVSQLIRKSLIKHIDKFWLHVLHEPINSLSRCIIPHGRVFLLDSWRLVFIIVAVRLNNILFYDDTLLDNIVGEHPLDELLPDLV